MEDAAADAQLLYDFLRMPTSPPPTKADAILVLGSNDLRVAKRAAELHAAGLAPLVVFSGARGNFTQDLEQTEAEWLADAARREPWSIARFASSSPASCAPPIR